MLVTLFLFNRMS